MKHFGEIISEKEGKEVINCETCGFLHISPLPTNEVTETLYSKEYYEKNRVNYLKNLEEDRNWWQQIYSERIDIILELLMVKEEYKVLDIGTGAGYFLKETNSRGWIGLGIEPSLMASFHGIESGLDIIQDFYTKELSEKIGKFDVIHMNHVLEHMANPKEVIELIYNNLEDDGVFCISVPNDFNELQNIASVLNKNEQWWICPDEHLNYFSFSSLKSLLNQCGFEILEETTTFPMEIFILMGDNYIGDSSKGRAAHLKRKIFEENLFSENPSLKRRLYKALAKENLGRDITLFARKNVKLDDRNK